MFKKESIKPEPIMASEPVTGPETQKEFGGTREEKMAGLAYREELIKREYLQWRQAEDRLVKAEAGTLPAIDVKHEKNIEWWARRNVKAWLEERNTLARELGLPEKSLEDLGVVFERPEPQPL